MNFTISVSTSAHWYVGWISLYGTVLLDIFGWSCTICQLDISVWHGIVGHLWVILYHMSAGYLCMARYCWTSLGDLVPYVSWIYLYGTVLLDIFGWSCTICQLDISVWHGIVGHLWVILYHMPAGYLCMARYCWTSLGALVPFRTACFFL